MGRVHLRISSAVSVGFSVIQSSCELQVSGLPRLLLILTVNTFSTKFKGRSANLFVGYCEVDRLVVLWSQIFTAVGVVAIFCFSPWLAYSPYQYIAAAILIFVSTNVLEGVDPHMYFLCSLHELSLIILVSCLRV